MLHVEPFPNVIINPDVARLYRTYVPIGFDMDSVMNTMGVDGMAPWIAKHFGVEDANGYDENGRRVFHFDIPGVTDKEMFKAVLQFIKEEGPSLLTSPYMKEVMQYVYDVTGVPIHIITARVPEVSRVTYNWLQENMGSIPYVCYMVHGMSKTPLIQHHEMQAFVDDRYKTVFNLLGHVRYPVCYQQPWNRGRRWNSPYQIRDLRDVIPLVNILTGRDIMSWPKTIPYPKRQGDVCLDF